MSMTLDLLVQRVETLEKNTMNALLFAMNVSDDPTEKPKKPDSDDDKPKTKRTSGYILYSNAHREQVKEELSDGETKPKNTDIMYKLAENWRELDNKDKAEWNAKAKELNKDAGINWLKN